jgi:trans-AT polyketide synthase/acyltransferase/oxidoreductase domain-containing protein
MSHIYMFPGQGAQFRGMGKELFDLFPRRVEEADAVLGYSVRELCLKDPGSVLNRTDYTQPALYVVNALSYFRYAESRALPRFVTGHSLGEFNALMVAGAFDFATGLKIVKKRGELMARAELGTMSAVMHLSLDEIRVILDQHQITSVDIANINSEKQVIISGLLEDIQRCEQVFENAGAKCVRLNVSAAFHSRHMKPSQEEFEHFLNGVVLGELQTQVVSNWTGDLYPRQDYRAFMANQLSHPVQWYRGISRLLASGFGEFIELGPNEVLGKLLVKIREKPQSVPGFDHVAVTAGIARKNVFMYSGQGSQYYQMGRELYEKNPVFRANLDLCSGIVKRLSGVSLVETLYASKDKTREFSDITATHPALFAFGYSLTHALLDAGLKMDAVVGYSLGEYVAATVSGALSLEDALAIIVRQAKALAENGRGGGMLTVITHFEHFTNNPGIYHKVELAGVNYRENFVLSGDRVDLVAVQKKLDDLGVPSMLLPVEHGFHSSKMHAVESEFKAAVAGASISKPNVPAFSAALAGPVEEYDNHHFWIVARGVTRFADLLAGFSANDAYRFIDLSPTGTLSTFIKYGNPRLEHYAAVTPFGRNLDSVNRLVRALGGSNEIQPIGA